MATTQQDGSTMKKRTEDYSDLVKEKIPEYKDLAIKHKKFGESIEKFLALEKTTRQGGDSPSTSKVLVAVAEVCFECKEFKALNEHIVAFSKRRGLIKEAIKQMVKKCLSLLDSMSYDPKLELLNTLLEVTEGKIYVEKQRARLTLKLAHIRESEGKIAEAAKILQEVQVETFGAMKKREKTQYILEQMRLCLKKKDHIRTQIISKKINPRALADPDMQDLKVAFYEHMVQYHLGESRNHLEIAKAYNQIYETPNIKADEQKWKKYLQLIVLYIVLAKHDNEQSDFINRLAKDSNLPKLESYEHLIKQFLTPEVLSQQVVHSHYKDVLLQLPPFADKEEAPKLWDDFNLRIVEHNIRVIASYYNRITMKRLTELLSLPNADVESNISRLVCSGALFAKIDRPKGIVVFKKPEFPSDTLNKWGSDIDSLLKMVENTCHLIHRENMVHKSQQ